MPKRPKMSVATIIVLVVLSVVVLTTVAVLGPDVIRHFKSQRLLKDGVAATAVIKEMTDTGSRFNRNPEVRLTLEVTPKDGQPYTAQLTTVISTVNVARLHPGAIVNVKYDPEQPTHVALARQ